MKVKRKYIKKIPDLKEFKELSHNLTRSFLKINELSDRLSFAHGRVPIGHDLAAKAHVQRDRRIRKAGDVLIQGSASAGQPAGGEGRGVNP